MFFQIANQRICTRAKMAFHVAAAVATLSFADLAAAKDLYVAPTGNDAVTYASNSISTPWKTINHALYNLNAGDHVYIRAGTYTPSYPVYLANDYTSKTSGGDPNAAMNSVSGTSSQPVVIENYNGEAVTVNLSNIGSSYINLDNKSYWTFRGLNFVNTLQVFMVGENYPTNYNTFENLTVTATRGGDNLAAIHLDNSNAEYTTIKGCKITGPGQSVHQNTSTIYINRVTHVSVLNNTLSNAPIGVYFKLPHSATSASQVGIEVAYNYITNTGRAGIDHNTAYTNIHDNIFGTASGSIEFGEDFSGAYNTVSHNTFMDGGINILNTTAINNTVANNIFMKGLTILKYSTTKIPLTLQRNVYPSSTSITAYGGTLSLSTDSTALTGVPVFQGGTSPTTIAGYALTSSSIGKSAATDGTDIGVRTDKMGVATTTPTTPSAPSAAPSAPSGLNILVQ